MEGMGFRRGDAGAFGAGGYAPQQQQQARQAGDQRQLGDLFQAPTPVSFQYGQGLPQQQNFGATVPVPAVSFGMRGSAKPHAVENVVKARDFEDEDGYRSECWGGSTASSCESSSDHSPPPSEGAFGAIHGGNAGGSDWDLLSEMLLDDALGAATASGLMPPPQAASTQFLPYQQQQMHQHLSMATNWPQQQVVDYNQRFRQYEPPVEPPVPMNTKVLDDQAALGGSSSPPATASMETPPQLADTSISPSQRPRTIAATARQKKKAPAKKQPAVASPPNSSPQAMAGHRSPSIMSISSSSSVSGSPVSTSATTMAASPPTNTTLSAEELKKLRRRTQIASSVQRHREKKKCVVSTLKNELSGLTAQLEELRAQRKDLHADVRLVEWEETAVTQRRKRKQSEELNARMKKALFQQTAFLMGMRGLLSSAGEPLGPNEMEFHDWIHSYTVLSARGKESRRRELVAHFSESKMDLAKKLVLRETDPILPRLNRLAPYYATTRVLHDGTQQFVTEPDDDPFVIKQEIDAFRSSRVEKEAGDGRVLKKFMSVFLFEESATITLERLHNLVFESTKGVGIYWPADGYVPRTFDHALAPTSSPSCSSNVFYADMAASMSVMDDLRVDQPGSSEDGDERGIFVEARVLCRETRDEHEGVIVWDYVDRDDLSSSKEDESAAARNQRAIRRNCCGSVVIKREPCGILSVRSISVKMFAPECNAGKIKTRTDDVKPRAVNTEADQEEEQLRALFRRIGLQATEVERSKEKCTRFVYNALQSALATDA